MVGWHQDDAHEALGPCHFQVDYRSETVQRVEAQLTDVHPLNVFDERTDQLVEILDSLVWEEGRPFVPEETL